MNRRDAYARVLISTVALGAALLHIVSPFKLDNIALALLGIALMPWFASILHRAELPGGLKHDFQEPRAEQARQARKLEAIKFLVGNFLTAPEQDHLEKIGKNTLFLVTANNTSSFLPVRCVN